MPGQDVALLNAWRFRGRYLDQDIDQRPHLPTGSTSERDRKKAKLSCTDQGFHYVSRITGSANADCNISGRAQSSELTRECLFIAVVIADGGDGGTVGVQRESWEWRSFSKVTPQELGGKVLRIRCASPVAKKYRLMSGEIGGDQGVCSSSERWKARFL